MTAPQSSEQLGKWLKATTISDRKQKAFVKRFEQEGTWTNELAEAFVEILFQSLKTYENEILQVSKEVRNQNIILDDIEADIEQAYQRQMPKILHIIDKELAEADQFASHMQQSAQTIG